MTPCLLVENDGGTQAFDVDQTGSAESVLALLDAREAVASIRSGQCARIAIPTERLLQVWLTPHRNAVNGFVYEDLHQEIAALAAAQHAACRPGATVVLAAATAIERASDPGTVLSETSLDEG